VLEKTGRSCAEKLLQLRLRSEKVPFQQSEVVETCKPWLQCTATHHVKAQVPYGKNGNAPLPSHPWAASLLGQS